MEQKIIEIENLTKYYGKTCGIKNVSFDIKKGEIFGFIGPNGAGKSSLIRTILGLQKPTSGTAKIFGEDINNYAKKIASDIGYLPSEVFYYDGMKVKELLNYSASFYKKDCKKRIVELSERLELDLERKISDLSYGNRKKVGIVQALLHEPKILILDEPTGGLDPLMQQKFFEILEEENKRGTTIFLSSHILSEVQRLCQRVAIIKKGEIISISNIHEIREDNYKKINIKVREDYKIDFSQLSGVTNLTQKTSSIEFLFKGNMNNLLQLIASESILDLTISEPSLEEIFLHYYQ